MIDLLTALVSASLGASVVIFTNWWRTRYTVREQDFSKRVEEVIKKIEFIEDLSCKYWGDEDTKSRSKYATHEIIGKQTQLELLINFIINNYDNIDSARINEALAAFNEASTGDEFSSNSELYQAKPERIQHIFYTAEELKLVILTERVSNY